MVRNYLSLVKFSHTIFAMPFALLGFTLAAFPGGEPAMEGNRIWVLFIAVVVCMVTARSAAMAFNRWLDRHFDAKNPRTAIREIPAGIVSPEGALRFTLFMAAAFIVTTALINPLCLALSPVALAVVLGYSYTKRFTPLCHLVLGVGLSLAPIGAYLAVTGAFAFLPILFSFAVLCWVSGFDIIYALQDVEFDRSQGLHSGSPGCCMSCRPRSSGGQALRAASGSPSGSGRPSSAGCWPTSSRWCGPTTSPASTSPS
jgi:4-hydroxybenzoate polyprenyltransferase